MSRFFLGSTTILLGKANFTKLSSSCFQNDISTCQQVSATKDWNFFWGHPLFQWWSLHFSNKVQKVYIAVRAKYSFTPPLIVSFQNNWLEFYKTNKTVATAFLFTIWTNDSVEILIIKVEYFHNFYIFHNTKYFREDTIINLIWEFFKISYKNRENMEFR